MAATPKKLRHLSAPDLGGFTQPLTDDEQQKILDLLKCSQKHEN
jgi:coenzyme F420-reducing hydrogenase alpha subunit